MAQTLTNDLNAPASSRSFSRVLADGFDWFITLGDRSSRGKAINALAFISDAELSARGTTRLAEAQRILGQHHFL